MSTEANDEWEQKEEGHQKPIKGSRAATAEEPEEQE